MKKIMILGFLASSFVFADEGIEVASLMQAPIVVKEEAEPVKASYGYVSLGVGPLPLPASLFGVGGRYQHEHNGVDGSLQFFTLGSAFTIAKENIDYLYYFKPDLASQFYMGVGVGFTEFWSKHNKMAAYLSPQLILGQQYTNSSSDVRYFQAQIDPVFLDLTHLHKRNHSRVGTFPAVVLSYGICF
jgi:hypothetical protein